MKEKPLNKEKNQIFTSITIPNPKSFPNRSVQDPTILEQLIVNSLKIDIGSDFVEDLTEKIERNLKKNSKTSEMGVKQIDGWVE